MRRGLWLDRLELYRYKNALGWHLYYLYGLERAASLSNVEKIGNHDWYVEGYRVLLKSQDPNGGWNILAEASPRRVLRFCFSCERRRSWFQRAPLRSRLPRHRRSVAGCLAGGRGCQPICRTSIPKMEILPPRRRTRRSTSCWRNGEPEISESRIRSGPLLSRRSRFGQREQLIARRTCC